jgi:integrase
MKKKFNPKEYRGKKRVFVSVTGYKGISKLWSWSAESVQYEPPARGKAYEARRSYKALGKTVVEKGLFESLQAARDWQLDRTVAAVAKPNKAPTFSEVVERFKSVKYVSLQQSSRDLYDRLLRLHFQDLMPIKISDFTPQLISQWIEDRKAYCKTGHGQPTRTSLSQELTLLSNILNFCVNYYDDVLPASPIKARHRDEIVIKVAPVKNKDITEEQFLQFREKLLGLKNGQLYYDLATVQHYQGLRISEACAIDTGDVSLNLNEPAQSSLTITKSIYWPRKSGREPIVKLGFKNSKKLGGKKVSYLLPESYAVLRRILERKTAGLVFEASGKPLEYRSIQHAYNRALKLAELPYTSTHVLRHGGGSLIYNRTGDLSMVAEYLGNTVDVAKVYAHRDKQAIKQVTKAFWADYESKT